MFALRQGRQFSYLVQKVYHLIDLYLWKFAFVNIFLLLGYFIVHVHSRQGKHLTNLGWLVACWLFSHDGVDIHCEINVSG